MVTPITITVVWLRSMGNGRIEVLCEIDGVWRCAIRDIHDSQCDVSHIAEGNGAREWPVNPVIGHAKER